MICLCLHSVSYTGTTWINFILASHARGFALANPDYAYRRFQDRPQAMCQVHGEACTVWPSITERMGNGSSMLRAIRDATNRDFIVLSNPRSQEIRSEIRGEASKVIEIGIVRDARALAASYARKNPGLTILDILEKWLLAAVQHRPVPVVAGDLSVLRYEDIVASPLDFLSEMGRRTGVAIPDAALSFWAHEHHMCSGNSATVRTVQVAQGISTFSPRHEAYNLYLKEAQQGTSSAMRDERWRRELSRFDLFAINQSCGASNHARGYARDVFSGEERRQFGEVLAQGLRGRSPRLIRGFEPVKVPGDS
jgi:hypothetical protein